MEQARRAVGERHDCILDLCEYLALDDDIATKDTGIGAAEAYSDDAGAGV